MSDENISCETHIDQALEEFIEKQETFPVMEKFSGRRKVIHKVQVLRHSPHRILWRTDNRAQYIVFLVDMCISSVYNFSAKVDNPVNITIVTVGKLKEKYLKMGIDEYAKRLGAYAKIDLVEVADEKAPESLSEADMEIVKKKEGERILAKISQDAYVIALAIEGKMKTSEELAAGYGVIDDIWAKQSRLRHRRISRIT